ncbi:MAG TPA: hypothetical protein VKV21_04945 [Solirubrobacteraceae bacterium]|nr:hypothetical protein [Solirubrobacteraceae bacterium]
MTDDPGAVVYGTMLAATLLAAETPGRETYAETAGAVAVAALVYWLAHAYSTFADHRARSGHGFALSGLRAALIDDIAVLAGAAIPLLVVLACWAAGASLMTGVWVAIGASIGTIVATEIALGLRSDHSGRELVVRTAVGVTVGVAILAVKLLLH